MNPHKDSTQSEQFLNSLKRRGATVIVNDIGGDVHGAGSDTSAVDKVTRS